MQILVVIIAGRFGPQPYPGPFVVGFIIIVAIVACILLIVNRKELDDIDKDKKSKDEPPKMIGRPWKCSKCGEMLEPEFDSCWKCGAVRKDEPAS
jgi:hypothetical protein